MEEQTSSQQPPQCIQPPPPAPPPGPTKVCPFCAETIQSAAIKCRFCGEALTSAPRRPRTSVSGVAGLITGAGSIFLPYFVAVFLVPLSLICGYLACRSGRRGLGVAGIALGLLGLIGVIYTSMTLSQIVKDPFSVSLPGADPPVVTLAEYEQVAEGMSLPAVQVAIGAAGTEMSRSELAGFTTVMYSWTNSNGSNMTAMFQNGHLVNKAQFGLR